MKLPPITHAQFAALHALQAGDRPGPSLRKLLQRCRAVAGDVAFHQFTQRLEAAGLIRSRWETIQAKRTGTRQRVWKLTGRGETAIRQTLRFYNR